VLSILTSLFIFPLTMAYVIVVHRAMDVRVVVRRGLQYVFAKGTLRVVQFALSVLVVVMVVSGSGGAESAVLWRVALVSAGLAAVLFIQRFADRLRESVDRRFFREAYDAERI